MRAGSTAGRDARRIATRRARVENRGTGRKPSVLPVSNPCAGVREGRRRLGSGSDRLVRMLLTSVPPSLRPRPPTGAAPPYAPAPVDPAHAPCAHARPARPRDPHRHDQPLPGIGAPGGRRSAAEAAPTAGKGLMRAVIGRIRRVFGYRELLGLLVFQSLALRYRRTVLGFVWSLISPVLTMAILAAVFHFVIRIDMANYAVFLFSAMLPWSFFALTLADSSVSIIHGQDLVTRQPIPKLVLPLSVAGGHLVNLVLSIGVLAAVVGPQLGVLPSASWIYLPIGFVCLFAFALGLGAALSALTVYLRDVQHIVTVFLPAWMYASPVLYPLELPNGQAIIPFEYHGVFQLNPIYWILQLFARPIYWGTAPSGIEIAIALGVSTATLVLGLAVFWWKEDDLVFHL